MGTISDKLTYLIETKSQLKDMINYGLPTENQITSSTTFRNYVKSIFEAFLESLRDSTTLYTNLPKISGNGTQITLNDTANAPMRITLNPTAISQDGTPTPSSPQDIHTISGNNSVVVNGKNLLDTKIFKNRTINCYVVNSNGTITQTATDTNFWQSSYLPNSIILNKGTYTISVNNRNGSKLQVYNLTTNSNIVEASVDSYTFTLNNDNQVINAKLYGASSYPFTFTMQLEKGTATTYEPYVSQTAPINLGNIEYCKIGNYEDEFIRTSGKNLLNPNVATSNCSVDTTTGIITITANTTDTYIKGAYVYTDSNKFLTLPSGSYYIKSTNSKVRITLYSDGSALDTTNNQPITLSSETNFGGLRIRSTDSSSLQNVSFGIMISTTDTPYEPYGTNQWYLKKNIGKDKLTSDNVVYHGVSNNIYQYELTPTSSPIQSQAIMSTHFTHNTATQWWTYDNNIVINTTSGTIHIYMTTTQYADITTFNQFTSSNEVYVYYAMATPTYTQITGTLETQLENIYENMLSYKGTTNISQVNNDLPFVLGVSAIQDLE